MVNDVAPPRKTPLLCHVTDPEDKRRIIGDTFMRVANEVIEDLSLNPDEVILGQGMYSLISMRQLIFGAVS